MAEEVKITPPSEVKEAEAPIEEANQEPVLGDVLQTEPTKEPELKTVGLDKFLDIKKQNKELKREMEKLQERIENGDSTSDVSEDIESIAEEFNVDKKFLNKLEKSIRSSMDTELETKVSERMKPLEQERKQKDVDKIFEGIYGQAIERMPEYANIIDKDTVRSLATLKENAALSLPQLIEKMYGKSISGRKTVETTTPRGGKESQEIDYKLAVKDPAYFKEIMADPNLKKKYNDNLEARLSL